MGGFGAHFNRSPKPHAHLTRRWLLAHGIPEGSALAPVYSRFTFRDAEPSKPVVARYNVRHLKVVTSDVHVARARLMFEWTFPEYSLAFCSSRTVLPRHELDALVKLVLP